MSSLLVVEKIETPSTPLSPLPEEVLSIIWEYVRRDLRPRMKRAGPLLQQIRIHIGSRLATTYGIWLCTRLPSSYPLTQHEKLEILMYNVWRFYGLEHMRVSFEDGKWVFWEDEFPIMEPCTSHPFYVYEQLWGCAHSILCRNPRRIWN